MDKINYKICVGTLLILLIVFFSFFPELIVSNEPAPLLLLDEGGNFIAKRPYSPVEYPPLGTNLLGESLIYNLLSGAKYTIIFVIVVCLLRMTISLGLAILYAFYVQKCKYLLNRMVEISYIIPPVIIVFFLLAPMTALFREDSVGFMFLLMLVLISIGIPPLTLLLGDEIKGVLQMDFIKIARLQGVSNFYIFKEHVWRILRSRIEIIFIQNAIQLLLLLVHLGVLGIFIGGDRIVKVTDSESKFISISNEWGGLVGSSYREFLTQPWVVLAPLFSFMILIMLLKLIHAGMKESAKLK